MAKASSDIGQRLSFYDHFRVPSPGRCGCLPLTCTESTEGPGVLTPLYLPYTDFDPILARTQTDNYLFFSVMTAWGSYPQMLSLCYSLSPRLNRLPLRPVLEPGSLGFSLGWVNRLHHTQ